MARIILASYAVRFPLGGYLSWVLQWLVGLKALGHDVYFVEKSGWPGSCYDPTAGRTGDDCEYGTAALHALLGRFELADRWAFVDAADRYHGQSREAVAARFASADLFIDLGLTYGEWDDEAAAAARRLFVDSDPALTQMLWEKQLAGGASLPAYDFHYTVGRNIGTADSTAPTAGRSWRTTFNPVNVDLFPVRPLDPAARFTTIMSWHHKGVCFNGAWYGGKDVEFEKFFGLPGLTASPIEVAVSGPDIPIERLGAAGWRVCSAIDVTGSFDDFRNYIAQSRGELTVAKHAYVATNSGWFSDRGAAYLASGRPVVMEDTGFSAHLPCGEGLFAVRTPEAAAAAIDEINGNWRRHSRAAREIAREYLDTPRVLRALLDDIGL